MDEDPAGRSAGPGGDGDANPGGDDGGWFFDRPAGAWERKEARNEGSRQASARDIEERARDRRLVRPPDADLLPPPEKRRLFGRKRRNESRAWESPGGTFQLRRGSDDDFTAGPDDDWSTEGASVFGEPELPGEVEERFEPVPPPAALAEEPGRWGADDGDRPIDFLDEPRVIESPPSPASTFDPPAADPDGDSSSGRFDWQDDESDIISGMRVWSSSKTGRSPRAEDLADEPIEGAPPAPEPALPTHVLEDLEDSFEAPGPAPSDADRPARRGFFARLFGRQEEQPSVATEDEEDFFADFAAEPPLRSHALDREAERAGAVGELATPDELEALFPSRSWDEVPVEAAPVVEAAPGVVLPREGSYGFEPVDVVFEGSLDEETWAPEPIDERRSAPSTPPPAAFDSEVPSSWAPAEQDPEASSAAAQDSLAGDAWAAWDPVATPELTPENALAAQTSSVVVDGEPELEPAAPLAELPSTEGLTEEQPGLGWDMPEDTALTEAEQGWETAEEETPGTESLEPAVADAGGFWDSWSDGPAPPEAAAEAAAASDLRSAAEEAEQRSWASWEPFERPAAPQPGEAPATSGGWDAWDIQQAEVEPEAVAEGPVEDMAAAVEMQPAGELVPGGDPWDEDHDDTPGVGEPVADEPIASAAWEPHIPGDETPADVTPGEDDGAPEAGSGWMLEPHVQEPDLAPAGQNDDEAEPQRPVPAADGPDVLGYLDEILPDGEPPPPPPLGGVRQAGGRRAASGWSGSPSFEDDWDAESAPHLDDGFDTAVVGNTADDEMDLVLRAFEAHAASGDEPVDLEPIEELLGDDAAELIGGDGVDHEPLPFVPGSGWAPQRSSRPGVEVGAAAWDSHASAIGAGSVEDEPLGGWAPLDEAHDDPPWDDRPLVAAGASAGAHRHARTIVREVVETGLLALLVFLAVRASFQNFKVDGDSMYPTLHNGEFLIVNKIVYSEVDKDKLARFVPFVKTGENPKANLFHGPQRGDIIVFRDPRNPDVDLIKRIVGLPGETVEIVEGKVYINDHLLEEPYIEGQWRDTKPKVQVGPDEYFVMGDNRSNSLDSRVIGFVHRDLIIGKALLSYWPKGKFGLAPNQTPTLSDTELRPGLAALPVAE